MLKRSHRTQRGTEEGFTLLEYCAGAAVLLTIVWLGLTTMGTGVQTLLIRIGDWATAESGKISE